ncbi:hypothetical protein [Larkinella terrae]|uniref:DUF4595 domain-containing protein n=1 Tax=Larkinella terrae TaxID=2025311 RepID=A0A7K0EK42_9BACT|nr:hypothetical protein [Larkinella terrae]MRS62092.1 hypothetical protein [Larkinella terrae]
MFNPLKKGVLSTIFLVTASLSACHNEQDVIPAQRSSARVAVNLPGAPNKIRRLTQVGKMKVYYAHDGIHEARIDKVDNGHHRIQYDYQAGNKILISHYYDNLLGWTTLVQLDANGRCISSKSTDFTQAKKYVSDEHELFYSYNDRNQLTWVSASKPGAIKLSGYEFRYYEDPFYLHNILQLRKYGPAGNLTQAVNFLQSQYWNNGDIAVSYWPNGSYVKCPFQLNKGGVNQALHLNEWGADPVSDIIDFFLPIYGAQSSHLLNGAMVIEGQNFTEVHSMTYDLDADGYVSAVYTHNEKTTPYAYELVDPVTPKPH